MEFFETIVTEQAKKNVLDCLNSGMLSEGKRVQEFELALEGVFGYRHGVAVNSCTSALHMALALSGVEEGDEVILPAQTFVATGLAVLYCGATPVFADIDVDTGNISCDSVIEKITSKTKAVICVAWGGNPPDLYRLELLCGMYGLKLIQDNAQTLGALYKGDPVTGFGDFSCFSFQAIKHLTTGDGGLLCCKDVSDYEEARRMRWFGIDRETDLPDETGERQYNLNGWGFKYHMNDLSAAVGLGNMNGLAERQMRRNEIADYYDKNVRGRLVRRRGSANWLYTLLVDRRLDFIRHMKSHSIPVSVVHDGIHKNEIFHSGYLENQEYWDDHHICLPIHSSLMDEDVESVVKAIGIGWWYV